MGRRLMVSKPLSRSSNPGPLPPLLERLSQSVERQELRIYADQRATVTLALSDDDFAKLVSGKTQAQRLFMSGKLKIRGDVMKVGYGSLSIFIGASANIRRAGYKDGTCT